MYQRIQLISVLIRILLDLLHHLFPPPPLQLSPVPAFALAVPAHVLFPLPLLPFLTQRIQHEPCEPAEEHPDGLTHADFLVEHFVDDECGLVLYVCDAEHGAEQGAHDEAHAEQHVHLQVGQCGHAEQALDELEQGVDRGEGQGHTDQRVGRDLGAGGHRTEPVFLQGETEQGRQQHEEGEQVVQEQGQGQQDRHVRKGG